MEEAPSSSSRLTFSLGIDIGKTALELALRDGKHTVGRTTVHWRLARTREPDRLAPRSRSRTRKNLRVHGGQWRLSGGRRPISPRRRIPGQRSQSEADQRVRCESAPTCVDRRCRCGLNCSLRSAGRPKGVGTAFSGGEPTSGAYKSSTGSEERKDPDPKLAG
jgi:hypothetical protein